MTVNTTNLHFKSKLIFINCCGSVIAIKVLEVTFRMLVLLIGFIIAVVIGIYRMNEAERHHKDGFRGFDDDE
jgi:hypothetical protein